VSKVSTLLIRETNELETVKQFLKSKGRKSNKTKTIYSIALSHFQTFLHNSEYSNYNIETIIGPLADGKINVYTLMDKFVGYLDDRKIKLSYQSVVVYIAGVKSYLEYYDVDISSNKFRKKVTLPSKEMRSKEPIDAEDIRAILLACTSVRLKALLLVLASSGCRVGEALSLRNGEVNFDQSPTIIHIRAENAKTKQERDVYISNEASRELKKFIHSRYGVKDEYREYPNHFIFTKRNLKRETVDTRMLYVRLHDQFIKLLDKVEKNQRNDGRTRRNITFHSLRSFVKSVISIHTTQDYSEWFLGHSYSTYWNIKESERRELYKKCEKYLTFLDYPTVENIGRDFEARLEERDKEIELIKIKHDKEMKEMDLKLNKVIAAIQRNPKLSKIKPEVLKRKIK
jgi:integrase